MRQHPAVRLHLLLLAAFLLLQGAARAQDYLNDPHLPAPKHWEGTPEGSSDFLWNDLAYPKAEEIDTKLARVRFLVDVARDFDGARKEMKRLWLSVNFWNGFTSRYGRFEGKEALYVGNLDKVVKARIELQLQAGNADLAVRLAEYPYFHAMDPSAQGMALAGFQEEQAKAILDRAFSANWNQYRATLSDSQGNGSNNHVGQEIAAYIAEHFGTSSPELTNQVEFWMYNGHVPEVQNLGLRATPALAMLILRDLEGRSMLGMQDPLIVLASADEQGACRLASDYFHRGGQSFRLRVLHLLEEQANLEEYDAWKYGTVSNRIEAPRCQVPHWVDVVAKLASNERTLPRVMSWIQILAERDSLTPELQNHLSHAITSGDSREAVAILTILDAGGAISSCKPVLEAAMSHSDASVRALAAAQLKRYPYSSALVQGAWDSSTDVQLAVAQALTPREVTKPTFGFRGSFAANMLNERLGVTTNPESAKALAHLILSPDAEVRSQAIAALTANEWKFDSAAPYLVAAETNNANLAHNLMQASYPDAKTQHQVLTILAESESPAVLQAVDFALTNRADWESSAPMWADVLLSRLHHPQHGFLFGVSEHDRSRGVSRERELENILSNKLMRSPAGIREAIRISCILEDSTLLSNVLGSRSEKAIAAGVALLDAQTLLQAMTLAAGSQDNYAGVSMLLEALPKEGWAKPSASYASLITDANTGLSGRLLLARALSYHGIEGMEDVVFGVLEEEDHQEIAFVTAAYALDGQSEERKAQRALRALMNEKLTPDAVLALAHAGLWTDARAEVAAAILAPRFHEALAWPPVFTTGDGKALQSTVAATAFSILTEGPAWTDRHQEILIGALKSDVVVVHRAGIDLALQRQDEELIPVIGNAIRQASTDAQQVELIKLLASYMTREAGRELSQCVGAARHGGVAHEMNSALQQIRAHLQEQEYWQGEQEQQASQQSAIKELVEMLSDSDATIRIAAIDGLASFDAKEHLPKIIRMLKDKDEDVQRAARYAIRVLQDGITSLEPGGDD